jgi:cell shape-determining protein MreC
MNSIETKLNIVNSGISDLADDYLDINSCYQNMKRDYQNMYQVVFQVLDNITNAHKEYGKKKLKEIEIKREALRLKREALRLKRENKKQTKLKLDCGYTINTTPKL